jgi:hypothetical protein
VEDGGSRIREAITSSTNGMRGVGAIAVDDSSRGLPGEGVVGGVGGGLLVQVDIAWVDALADAREAFELDDVVFL